MNPLKVASLLALIGQLIAFGSAVSAKTVDRWEFWEKDIGQATTASLSISETGSSRLTLRFQQNRFTSYGRVDAQLARPLLLHLSTDEGLSFTSVRLAQVAFVDKSRNPILIDKLRLVCGRAEGLTASLNRYNQMQIYKERQGISFPFLDPMNEGRCAMTLQRSGVLDLAITQLGETEPSIRVRAQLPIQQQARRARTLHQRELARARSGKCKIEHFAPPVW